MAFSVGNYKGNRRIYCYLNTCRSTEISELSPGLKVPCCTSTDLQVQRLPYWRLGKTWQYNSVCEYNKVKRVNLKIGNFVTLSIILISGTGKKYTID